MELTKEVKEKLEGVQTEAEAKAIIEEVKKEAEEAGIVLDDKDLDEVAGGGACPLGKTGPLNGCTPLGKNVGPTVLH